MAATPDWLFGVWAKKVGFWCFEPIQNFQLAAGNWAYTSSLVCVPHRDKYVPDTSSCKLPLHTLPFSEPTQRGRPREIGVALVRNSERPYVRTSLVPKKTQTKTKGKTKGTKA